MSSKISLFPIFLIFAIIMGGLYLGFFTATESAAVGVILVLLFILVRGQLTLSLLKEALWTTIKTVGSLYLIVIGASIFNYLIWCIGIWIHLNLNYL